VRQLETRLTPSLSTLASFVTPDGIHPLAGVIMDGSGNLYGTASAGGAFSDGTVYELANGQHTITRLASFNGTNGDFPYGGALILDSSGNLYGTSQYGGSGGGGGDGTVFELAHGKHTITTLASFDGTDGAGPLGGLVMDSNGNLYGITEQGGASNYGTVFEVAKGSGAITTLASFNGFGNGGTPGGPLIMDSSGNLYGTTSGGGPHSGGTVFELRPGSGTITTLAAFKNANGTDSPDPGGRLIMDSNGDLYGGTQRGGVSDYGTLFELAKGSGTITTLASFDNPEGGAPNGGLVMDSAGNLFGTTYQGGAYGEGTVFKLANGSGMITTVASFRGKRGEYPAAGLFQDNHGNLYGTTSDGGAKSIGTVFELSGAAAPLTDEWTGANAAVDINWSDGANWSLGASPTTGQTAVFTKDTSVKSFTATVDAGFTHAIAGLQIDSTWGGTITVNSPLSVTGNFVLASGSFGGSGAVSISGPASHWTGGKIVVGSGGFTNSGTLNVDTTSGNLILTGAGALTNNGTINESGTGSLILAKTATLDNAAGATFVFTDNGDVSESGGGAFVNAGTLEKTGAIGTSTIATTTLSNTGTVEVTAGTLDISATVTQVSGRTLKGGTWTLIGSPTVHAKLDITSAGRFTTLGSGAKVMLSGTTVAFPNLTSLAAIDQGATLSLLNGQSRSTVGSLTNAGTLILSPGSTLTVSGSFTQTSTGTLTVRLGGTHAAPTFGRLVSTSGSVALGGNLDVTSTALPAVGSAFHLVDNEGDAAISGTFAGLPEGATFKVKKGTKTMTFQITYAGRDADGSQNIILTRVS
jgi:uncharacterized repeat protein (TIGR03803 family)